MSQISPFLFYTLIMSIHPTVIVNSSVKSAPEDFSSISVFDRGLAYGDGVFETMRVDNGEIILWKYHYQRLIRGLKRLGISLSNQRLFEHMDAALKLCQGASGVIKLTVTRGDGGRGYMPPKEVSPALVAVYYPSMQRLRDEHTVKSEQGVKVHYCRERLAVSSSSSGIKSLDQLQYVLAAQERQGLPFDEGLMMTDSDNVIEATARNLFIVKAGNLYTPPLNNCGVEGVMRRFLIDYLRDHEVLVDGNKNKHKISVYQVPLLIKDIVSADEVFLTNSVTHIWPIVHCSNQNVHTQKKHNYHEAVSCWPIGKITTALQKVVADFFRTNPSLAYTNKIVNES